MSCLYRAGAFVLANDQSKGREGVELVILTHSRHLAELEERWEVENSESEGAGK